MKRLLFGVVSALTLALLALPAVHASAAVPVTRAVDDDGMAVPGNCNDATPTFSTIQAAVDASNPGDTIEVCPGAYNESVTVGKSLTLKGAQAGVDGRTRSATPEASESKVVGGGSNPGMKLTASTIVVDGFLFSDSDPGVLTSISNSGYTIKNNVFRSNVFGLGFESSGSASLAEHNLFDSNNDAGSASGNGVYTDQGSDDTTVNQNDFTGQTNCSVIYAGTAGTQGENNITNNLSTGDQAICLYGTTETAVDGNTVTGSATHGVFLGGGNANTTISNNDLSDNTFSGVRIRDDVGPANTGTSISNNTLSGNDDAGVALGSGGESDSVQVHNNSITGNGDGADPGTFDGGVLNQDESNPVIDATNNWWGDSTGPAFSSAASWGIGSGDEVSAEVDFFPWFTNAGMTTLRSCDATATEGVTLSGTNRSEVLCGSTGNDVIRGRGGRDLILGRGGNDKLYGGGANDSLIGGFGNDRLAGNSGFDSLQGRSGTDKCFPNVDGGQSSTCEN